jgi:very-short-patch-repair endonuclease
MVRRHNRPEQKIVRKRLRNHSTKAEIILWQHLKAKQINGLKFRRQPGLGNYILDFYCPEKRLAIELDGNVHGFGDKTIHDKERQAAIESCGIKVLRFYNTDVLLNIQGVLKTILAEI